MINLEFHHSFHQFPTFSLCLYLSDQNTEIKVEDSGIAAPPEMPIVIDHIALKDILGPPLFEIEVGIK